MTRTDKTKIVSGFIFILILLSLSSGMVYAKSDVTTGSEESVDGQAGGGGEGDAGGWFERADGWRDYKIEKSIYYPCTQCHNLLKPNTTIRTLKDAHTTVDLEHGNGTFWCLTCHKADDRDKFTLFEGKTAEFDNPAALCGKCHGQIYNDWKDGIHGKRTGSWETEGEKNVFQCTKCHNPHDPNFKPIVPEAPPDKPAPSPIMSKLPILAILSIITFVGLVLFAARR